MDDRRRYNGMEEYLEKINRKYISFPKEVITRNNKILSEVLDPLIDKMCEDTLFRQLYNKNFYGGSYYDGLKVGRPNEYDIDLLLKFPSKQGIEIREGEVPGFVNMYMHNKTGFEIFCSTDEEWESFLDTNKVLQWMEGVVQRGLNNFRSDNISWYTFGTEQSLHVLNFDKGGPAFTLKIRGKLDCEEVEMDVDLVPCFLFSEEKWPQGFKMCNIYDESDENGNKPNDFFVVPKKPKGVPKDESKYWRLSFQIQERYLIHDKNRLKPALRLLKKMRDRMEHKQISSYYLKTVVLWQALEYDSHFWSTNSLSYIFMHILTKYQECLNKKEILYFWNDHYNFIDTVRGDVANMSNRLRRIINNIDRNMPYNPQIVVQYILTDQEQITLDDEPEEEKPSGFCVLI